MHLRLDDVDAAGAAVLELAEALQVVEGAEARDRGVQNALEHFVAIGVQDGVRGHQMAHVAYQQQTASGENQRFAVRCRELSVRSQGAMNRFAAFLERLLQLAGHQAQPVAIDGGFVFGIHCRHRIFAILNGGDGGFQQHVLDAGRMDGANIVGAIDLDFQMQAVVAQKKALGFARRSARETGELLAIGKSGPSAADLRPELVAVAFANNFVGNDIVMAEVVERRNDVQRFGGLGDHQFAPRRVVAAAFFVAVRFLDDIRAVEGVVEAAPAGIGGVQREARVRHRHH